MRRLTVLPLAIGATVIALIVAVTIWTLSNAGGPTASQSTDEAKTDAPGDASEVLSHAPSGAEIVAYRLPVKTPGKQEQKKPEIQAQAQTQSPPPAVQPAPGMTDAEIAGRKAAWQAYYQKVQELQNKRIDERREAMASDTVPASYTTGAAPQPPSATTASGKPMVPGLQTGDQSPQDKQNAFLSGPGARPETDYLPFTTTDPISPYELKATDIITAKMVSGLNSDSPGIIKGIVTKNVLDHATGMHILIPQGSTLMGVYDNTMSYGQTRVVVAWERIIYPPPCDQSLDIGMMPGADQSGYSGFKDLTDNHLGKVFLNALLVSVFGAGIQLSQPPQNAFSTFSPMQTVGGAVGQQLGQLGQEFARRGLSIPPTQEIRNGYDFTIMLTKDIAFAKPWVAGVCEKPTMMLASDQ